MEIKTKKNKSGLTVKLLGEMTIYSALEAKEALLAKLDESDELRLDLSEVCEIDSSGFQLLLMARREAAKTGKTIKVTGHSAATSAMLDLYSMRAYVDGGAGDRAETKTRKGC